MLTTLIIVLILIFLLYKMCTTPEINYIKSDIDGKTYMIKRGYRSIDFLKADANILAIINLNVVKLINHLQYNTDPSKTYFIQKLKENYNSHILSEGPIDKRYTSYTIDKEYINMCLRTRDSKEQIYDINLLMYVTIHELAHLCNYSHDISNEGHGKEFLYIFRFLIEEAIKIGVYKYEDYVKYPKEYCDLLLNLQII